MPDVFDTLSEPTGSDIFDLVGSDSPAPITEHAVEQTKSLVDRLKTPSPAFLQPFETAVKHNVQPFIEHPIQSTVNMIVPNRDDVEAIKRVFTDPHEAFKRDMPIGSQQWWDTLVGYGLPLILGAAGKAFKGPKAEIKPIVEGGEINAERVRSDEGQVPSEGNVQETSTVQSSPNLEQQAPGETDSGPGPEVIKAGEPLAKESENVQQQSKSEGVSEAQVQEVPVTDAAPSEQGRPDARDVPNQSTEGEGRAVEEITAGEATPPAPEPARITSIKNEQVDSERVQRGLEPAMATAGRDFGEVWDKAMQEVEKNPERPVELVQELKDKPRALSDTEDALLLHRQIDLQNQFEKTANELEVANESGNLGLVDELNLRAAKLSDDLLDIYNAGRGAGTETGRGLNARKMLAAEDYSLASMITKKRAAIKGGQLTPEQIAEVGKAHERVKKAQLSLEEYEAKRLAAFKKRTAKRTEELKGKVAAGDFTRKERTPIQLDQEGLRLRAELERAKLDFQKGLTKDRLANRPTWEKALDGIAKWRRTFVLTWPTVLAKLTSASGELIGITPLEEATRSVVTKVVPKVAAKAPRYGTGLNVVTEAKAIAHTFRTLFKAAGQKFKMGHSDIDLLYGKPDVLPQELKDYISNIHGALKEPARQNEFLRSFEKRLQFEARRGVDVTDPLVQTKVGFQAYKDANAQIFMENNMVAEAIQRGLHRFGEVNKQTGKASIIGKVAQTGVKFELPIVKIPLNIVKRSFEYSFGTASGSFRLARALVNGLDKLAPEEADVIIRNLSRGSLGLAFVAYGYFNPEQVGGYYQQGEKRGPDEVKAGGIQIGGLNIPRMLVHNPLLEQLQIGSTIRRVADSKLRKHDIDPQGIGAGTMAGYTGLIEEVPFIQQAERSLKALNPHERKQFLGELMRSAIPGVVEWAARMMDREGGEPVQRKPEDALDYPKAAIPVLRQDVPERIEKVRKRASAGSVR